MEMSKGVSLQVLADMVGGVICGDPEITVFGVGDLATAKEGEITFLLKPSEAHVLRETRASCVVAVEGVEADIPVVQVENPVLAITRIHQFFLDSVPVANQGIAADTLMGKGCTIASSVATCPRVTIGSGVILGERVFLESGVVVGDDVVIGDDCHLMANVVVRAKTILGQRVIIQSGTVIGSDGYGYVYDGKGSHIKRPHVGNVVIEDDVDIGANCCVDRATFGTTRIGRGTKIDNLVQIAHNVIIGQSVLIVAQCAVGGSSSLGNGVVMGGHAAVADHVNVGDGAMIAAKSGVRGRVKAGDVVSGTPAIAHKTWLRASSAFPKLPQLVKEIRRLEKVVAALEEKIS
jgi:UDP-3-O-[3-hydroxymyristoyl] glucosamine N-acyltransferase